MVQLNSNGELYHHGILGMKWGVRRWQNEDGTLTAAGYRHYGKHPEKATDEQLAKVKARYQTESDVKRLKEQIRPTKEPFLVKKASKLVNGIVDTGIDKLVGKIYSGRKKQYDLNKVDLDKIKDPEEMATIKKMMVDKKVAADSRKTYEDVKKERVADQAEHEAENAKFRERKEQDRKEEASKAAASWFVNNMRDMSVRGLMLAEPDSKNTIYTDFDDKD